MKHWNTFLAAEFPVAKGRAIFESLGSIAFEKWPEALFSHPLVTDPEKKRMRLVESTNLPRDFEIFHEATYPDQLRYSEAVHPVLSLAGNSEGLKAPCISIVGTRSASTYGKICARKFAEEFARHGATVISGGAIGIDGMAHEGALTVSGSTYAVIANGVDHVYPSVHAGLFQRMKERGGVISQFAAGTKPADYKFILRNQLIAAFSHVVVVIEAPLKSGAIRTAGFAGELGREVFVVPGPIDSFGFQGSHALIRDGATLVDHPQQVLETLNIRHQPVLNLDVPTGDAGKILSILNSETKSVEKIVELTGLGASEVLSELTMLELDGLILKDAGGFVKKI